MYLLLMVSSSCQSGIKLSSILVIVRQDSLRLWAWREKGWLRLVYACTERLNMV